MDENNIALMPATTLSFRCSVTLKKRLQRVARGGNCSVSQLAAELVELALSKGLDVEATQLAGMKQQAPLRNRLQALEAEVADLKAFKQRAVEQGFIEESRS